MPSEPVKSEDDKRRARVPESDRLSEDTNLRLLAAQIPDNIMLLDRDERIRFINWTVPDLTIDQVIGTRPYDYIPQPDRATAQAAYRRVLETGRPERLMMEYVAQDQTVSRWETRVSPLQHGPRIDGIIVVSSNVTERDEAAADRDRLFALSGDMMCVATFDGYFKRLNPAFTRVLGWHAAELTARPFVDFVHADDRAATEAMLARLRQGDVISGFENRYRCKDGGYRTLQWHAIGQPDLRLLHAVARDVTDHATLEQQLRQAQKMEAVGQLAGGLAHDFNNVLLAISMNADLAERSQDPTEVAIHLKQIRNSARRAAELTRQLLTFSRQAPLRFERVHLSRLVKDLENMLRRTIPENIDLAFDLDPDVPLIAADSGQLSQIVLNLCINSRDAIVERGRIVVVTTARAEGATLGVELRVSDDGVGMNSELKERIFEPFFTTKPAGQGTGLGLAVVYAIVAKHGGTIGVESQPHAGAAFRVWLPVGDLSGLPAVTDIPTLEQPAPRGRETILVAEDAPDVRSVVVKLLEQAGYRVLVAADGQEAVNVAREGHEEIQLALLDVIMPRLSGPEAAAAIRKLRPATKVLFTSGYSDGYLSGGQLAADRLLRKPYPPEELLRRVRELLDRAVVRAGD